MKLVFLGSGAFGLPTLRALARAHDIALVVTQPDRPAGRKRVPTATPIGAFAAECNLETIKPERINEPDVVAHVRGAGADAWVVIAYGQKLGATLLDGVFAINLHASLLPKYRGAAPINHAIIEGETHTGVSVITLADRMDAGLVLAQSSTAIEPLETAGELHDRLAQLGPEVIEQVLARHAEGTLRAETQDEALVTQAPKFTKADGTTRFDVDADVVRRRVHGLTPWPGCRVTVEGDIVRLHRVDVVRCDAPGAPGTVRDDGTIACARDAIRVLSIQPPGGKAMSWEAFRNGHSVGAGSVFGPVEA